MKCLARNRAHRGEHARVAHAARGDLPLHHLLPFEHAVGHGGGSA